MGARGEITPERRMRAWIAIAAGLEAEKARALAEGTARAVKIAEIKAERAKIEERAEESIRAIIGETAQAENLTAAEKAEFEEGVWAFIAEIAGAENLTEAEFTERYWAFQAEGEEVAP
jgi:hypothetical protein